MAPLFTKLNLKEAREVVVLNAPPSFEPELAALGGVLVRRDLAGDAPVGLALAFVTEQAEVDALAAALAARADGDAVLWFAYPKGSSKRYRCAFNRDTGWAALGALGFEGVRQVAVDEDWTALRFRRVEHVRALRRHPDGALTAEGKARAEAARG